MKLFLPTRLILPALALALTFLCAALALPGQKGNRAVAGLPSPAPVYVPGQVLVGIAGDAGAAAAAIAGDPSLTLLWSGSDVALVQTPAGQEWAAVQRLQALPGVRWAEPNYLVRGLAAPNDPRWPEQWWQQQLGVAQAWDIVWGDPQTIIAVADTGIDLDHPDRPPLWRNVGEIPGNGGDDDGNGKIDDVHGWHWYTLASGRYGDDDIQLPTEDQPIPNPRAFHGMHTAGAIAAPADNGIGVAGVARGPQIMTLRVLDENAIGSMLDVASAIRYAVDQGASIINLSLGSATFSQALAEATAYAAAHDVLLAAAAGNDGGPPLYPAGLPEVIAVGGSDASDGLYERSNRGETLDLVAPATGILSTWASSFRGGYHTLSGTSMAAAQVSGALALLRALRPQEDAATLQQRLYDSALDLGAAGWDPEFGWGRLQVDEAARQAAAGLTLTLTAHPLQASPGQLIEILASIVEDGNLTAASGLPVAITADASFSLLLTTTAGQARVCLPVPPQLDAGQTWQIRARWHDQEATVVLSIHATTPTITPTPTPTPTATSTPSPSPTPTPSPTPSPTPTPTLSPTPSPTPTLTFTPTPTPWQRLYLPLFYHAAALGAGNR